jgi:hypothetical protein
MPVTPTTQEQFFPKDMQTISPNTQWVLEELGSAGQPVVPNQPYQFDVITEPTYLATNNDYTANKITFNPALNGGNGAYVIAHQDTILSPTQAALISFVPAFPVLGGLTITLNVGDVVNFNFDLNGNVINGSLDYGPALFYNFFNVYQSYIHIPVQALAAANIPGLNVSANLNPTQAQLLALYLASPTTAQAPGRAPLGEQLTNAKNTVVQDATNLKNAATGKEPLNPKNSLNPFKSISGSASLSYTPLLINSSLMVTKGGFNIGITLGKAFEVDFPEISYPPGPLGAAVELYFQPSITITPQVGLSDDVSSMGGNLILTAQLTPQVTIAFGAEAGIKFAKGYLGKVGGTLTGTFTISGVIKGGGGNPPSISINPVAFILQLGLTASAGVVGQPGPGYKLAANFIDLFSATNIFDLSTYHIFPNGLPIIGSIGATQADSDTSLNDDLPDATQLGAPMGTNTFSSESLLSDSDANYYAFRTVGASDDTDQIGLNFSAPVPDINAFVQDAAGNVYASYNATDASDGTISLSGLPVGAYYLVVEGAPTSGVNYSMTFTTPSTSQAYLVASLSLDQTEIIAGGAFTAFVTIQNFGSVASNPGLANLVYSTDEADVSADDPQLVSGGIAVPALAPGQSFTAAYTVVIPATVHGLTYVNLIADVKQTTPQDNTLEETALAYIELDYPADRFAPNDNFSDATQLGGLVSTITENDLTIGSPLDEEYFQFDLPTTGTPSDTIVLQRTDNVGPADLSLFDSSGDDIQDAPITTGAGADGSETLNLDGLQAGEYYIVVSSVDGTPFPYNLTLNSAPRTGPNLAVQDASLDSSVLIPGLQQNAQVEISNFGSENAGGFVVQLALNINGTIVNLGTPYQVGQIFAGATQNLTIPFTVPSLPADEENLYAQLVVTVDPGNTLNSLDPSQDSQAIPVFLTLPSDSYAADEGLVNLGTVTGTETINNLDLVFVNDEELIQFRTIATSDSTDSININFPSGDGLVQATLLNSNFEDETDADATSTGSINMPIAGLPAGQYYLLVTQLQDLTATPYSVTLTTPAPVGANLALTNITVPAEVASGSTSVSATISNVGNEPVGSFQVQYVLTTDGNVLSPSVIDLGGPVTLSGLAAGASETDTRTLSLSSIPSGEYLIEAIVDPQHLIPQTSTDDDYGGTNLNVLPAPDAYEPNNTQATATSLTPVNGTVTLSNLTLTSPTDVDYFQFTLSTLSTYTDEASITYKTSEPDLDLVLTDANGNVLANDPGSNGSATLSLADLLAGTYYLQVSSPAEYGFSSGYSVTLALASTDNASATQQVIGLQSANMQFLDAVVSGPAQGSTVAASTAAATTSTSDSTVLGIQDSDIESLAAVVTTASNSSSAASSPAASQPVATASVGTISTASDSTPADGLSDASTQFLSATVVAAGDSSPLIVDVPNGGFSDTNPSDPNYAWSASGNVAFANNEATLTGGGNSLITDLMQELTVPAGATQLSFTLDGLNLLQGKGLPPDAFEVSVSNPSSQASLLATDGLSFSDAVLNIQAGGVTSYGSEVQVPSVSQTGGDLALNGPVTITINLAPLSAGTQLDLEFDLIAFASSSVSIGDVTFVAIPPGITSGKSATFTAGTPATPFTVTTTGFPNAAITEQGPLPMGVQFLDNGNGAATLSGTPAAGTGGVYTLSIDASNGATPDALQTFTLTVDQAPAITSSASASFTAGATGSFTITTTGYPTASLSEIGGLPQGLKFVDNGDGTATISGTPATGTGGMYTLTLAATNGVSPDAAQTFTINVAAPAPALTLVPSSQLQVSRGGLVLNHKTGLATQTITLTNISNSTITGPLSLVLEGLTNATLLNGAGLTTTADTLVPAGSQYVSLALGNGVLAAGQSITVVLQFQDPTLVTPLYTLQVLDGSGTL